LEINLIHEKRKANNEPTDPETPRNIDLKYYREKRTSTFQNSWIDKGVGPRRVEFVLHVDITKNISLIQK
jgi:hypothetical protein